MGSRILMSALALILPAMMLGFGYYYRSHVPKSMRSGYRTSRSRKSRETWVYAHRMLGGIWRRLGWLLLAAGVCVMLAVFGKDADTVANVSGTLSMVQAVLMGLSIIPIERALKRNFDETGSPINEETRELCREDDV